MDATGVASAGAVEEGAGVDVGLEVGVRWLVGGAVGWVVGVGSAASVGVGTATFGA